MGPPCIVVVEDEPDVRAVLVEALDAAGYAVEGFGAGADALARLAKLRPALILLDLVMPGMDGYEFLARLRVRAPLAGVPLLIVSAVGDSLALALDEQGARTLGVAGILTKPLDLRVLLEHVERIVGPPGA